MTFILTESLHRLCYQRPAADATHAPEQADLPVSYVGICGVAAVRVYNHGHDRAQHRRAHDEGTCLIIQGGPGRA